MLEGDYQAKLNLLLRRLQAAVEVPGGWTDYFGRQGILPAVTDEQRRYARRYQREEAICEWDQTLPAIPRRHEFSKVYLKDLSRTGVAFLAILQLYPGENVALWTSRGKLNCSVVRCIKHNERCYEIGASFD
jgi:hypothetical protein